MKNLTDFHKMVEIGVDSCLYLWCLFKITLRRKALC